MKIKLCPCNRAVALLVALLFAAAILVIGGALVYLLVRLCRQVLPDQPPSSTNQSSYVESVVLVVSNADTRIDLTTNQIPEMAIGWHAEVQRTTNMIDWEPILQTTVGHTISILDDTNPPPVWAGYRMHFYR